MTIVSYFVTGYCHKNGEITPVKKDTQAELFAIYGLDLARRKVLIKSKFNTKDDAEFERKLLLRKSKKFVFSQTTGLEVVFNETESVDLIRENVSLEYGDHACVYEEHEMADIIEEGIMAFKDTITYVQLDNSGYVDTPILCMNLDKVKSTVISKLNSNEIISDYEAYTKLAEEIKSCNTLDDIRFSNALEHYAAQELYILFR